MLHRKLIDNPVFMKPELLQLWIYCLLKANHKDNNIIFNNSEMTVKRGSFVTGRFELGKAVSQNPKTAYNRLLVLKNIGLLSTQSSNKFTVVTIDNYDLYQTIEVKEDTKMDNQRTTKGQQTSTNNNVNNVNTVNNVIKKVFVADCIELKLSTLLKSKIELNNPNAKTPTSLQSWAKSVDLMIRIDNRTPDQIKANIIKCQHDPFWKTNILSMTALRKQFDKITMMNNNSSNNQETEEVDDKYANIKYEN